MCSEEEPSTAEVDSHSAFYRVLPRPESGEIKSAEMVDFLVDINYHSTSIPCCRVVMTVQSRDLKNSFTGIGSYEIIESSYMLMCICEVLNVAIL